MGNRTHKQIKIWCGLVYALVLLGAFGWLGERALYEQNVPEEETSGSNLVTIEESSGSNEYTDPPKVALTFDDGPSSTCTGRLLDGLKERGVKATFFLIGENAEANPELVERINAEGHLIGNHTYHHVQITSLSDAEAIKEVKETDEVVYSITGKHVEYMRPPFGDWKKDLEYEMEVLPVLWTIDPLDWTTNNVDEIVNKVVTEVSENDIILLHDCYDSSVDAALRIVDYLQTEGYDLVTVDKLMLE